MNVIAYLVTGKNSKWIYDLLCSISVRALSGHEVEEGVEMNITSIVWIDNSQNSLKIDFTLDNISRCLQSSIGE